MKYNISGFDQSAMIELGLNADDLNILRWFIDFKDSGKMFKEYFIEENCFYYWINYNGLIEAFPYLFVNCNTEETKKKKLQRLLNGNISKILKKKLIKNKNGTYTFFALNEINYQKLLRIKHESCKEEYNAGAEIPTGTNYSGANDTTGTNHSGAHWNESFQPKDSSINNSSINNIKKEKGKKKTKKEPTQTEIDEVINAYTSNEELKATLIEFVKFRKSIKRVMTTHALELLIKKLDKLSNDDNTKIEILNESIMNGWNGIFPLKDNSTPNNKNKGGFNNESRSNTSKNNEPSKGKSEEHDAEYWKEQNRILDEMLDSYLQM